MAAPVPRASFRIEVSVPGCPDAVWDRLWDLGRHTAAIPLTRVRSLDGRPLGKGSRFVGRTGVGPAGFDDRMQVVEWQAPRRAVVRKTGPWLRGTIAVTLDADGDDTRVHWRQTLGLRGVPDAVARLVAPVVAAGYRHALRRIVGDGSQGSGPGEWSR